MATEWAAVQVASPGHQRAQGRWCEIHELAKAAVWKVSVHLASPDPSALLVQIDRPGEVRGHVEDREQVLVYRVTRTTGPHQHPTSLPHEV
jgi:hypothetical protein